MFKCQNGTFKDDKLKNVIDEIQSWSLKYFYNDLKKRPSLHRYIYTLPKDIQDKIYLLGNSETILSNIREQYPNSEIKNIPETDEFYISHYNLDNGGDQGLFTKHYDGNMRGFSRPTFIRALIYVSSDGSYEVEFIDCKKRQGFKKYDYALLDFNREYHTVHGSFSDNEDPRIVLKINYFVCPKCSSIESKLYSWMNLSVFKSVKMTMEWSKSPNTILKKLIGLNCNLFRILNNYSTYLVLPIIVFYLYLLYYLVNNIKLTPRNQLLIIIIMVLINIKLNN